MVRATVFVYLAWTAALVTPQDDLHYNTIIVDIIRHQELGNGVNLGDIPQSRDQESKVDDDIFADAEFDHEYEAVDKAAANALAPSPQPASVDRKHLNTAEVAKVERLAALAKNTPNAPIAEEDTDDGESNDDDDDDENDDVGDKVDGDEPPASRGNVPAAVDDDKASRGNVPAAVDDDKASRGNVPAAIDDDKAASTLAPSPTMQPDNVDRKHLNTAEVAKVERLAALVKNTANVPIDEEDTDGGERNDDDDDDDDDIDDVGDEVNGDKTPAPRGNATVAVDDAPIHAASVGAASPDHNVSSPTASPSPFGIIGITLGCVATVCAIVGVYRSRRQAATQFSSESTLYMDDIRLYREQVMNAIVMWVFLRHQILLAKPASSLGSSIVFFMCNLRQDKHSLANVDAVRVSHIDLTLAADFERRALHGHVALTSSLISPTNTFVLDSKALVVHRATVDGVDASFRHVDDAVFGTALHVTLPALALGVPFTARIYYETTPESTAVQWLPKEQTADKTHPYLFTQCQAIHARSLLPCQDCPLASSTYSAAITVPSWATCLVSAVARADPVTTGDVTTFSYHQAIAVPSYLIAIVIGALESREIGPRSRVWCEPSLVDAAAYEFAQTESFLQHAEAIMNQAYVWGRYDLVCLPPSFPLGGMENPCLTFATPTLLAGDQSLADVIAHEIAHSWTGNLITNHTWEDFWLNEGWTMWLQRKIMARIHSPLHFDFDASIGWNDLQHSIDRYGAAHEFTKLVPTLDGCDPDDAFSSVPYEKGFNFLYYLSKVVGDDQFELFAQAYVQHFKYKTVTSDAFKAFFIGYFTPTKATELATIDWQTWFYGPGMPPKPAFDTTISAASAALAQSWLQGGTTTANRGADDVAGWTSSQVVAMLDALLEAGATRHQYLDVDVLQSLGDVYHLVTTKNAEIRMRFQTLCIRSEAAFILPYVEAFLKEQGRMKFVRPLFRDLVKSKIGETHARRIFAEWKGYYHPICRSMVEKDLA